MKGYIEFSDIRIKDDGFTCSVVSSEVNPGTTQNLYFFANPPPQAIDGDVVAFVLSTLCGSAYSSVRMGVSVSRACAASIDAFVRSQVTFDSREMPIGKTVPSVGYVLNFSGGFDSLAAKALMPEDVPLVSMEWGGRFSREQAMYSKFGTRIVTTNAHALGYCAASWTFMGIGMLLCGRELFGRHYVFGGNFEETIQQTVPNPPLVIDRPPFSGFGMKNMMLGNGLSAVGTAMVVSENFPQLINQSLLSLGEERSEKRFRKYLLASIANERHGLHVRLDPALPPVKPYVKFGQRIDLDLLSLYEAKFAGIDQVMKTLFDLPPDLEKFARSLKLAFFERLNTNFLPTMPCELQAGYFARLAQSHVLPYDENDWKELAKVREYLASWHKEYR